MFMLDKRIETLDSSYKSNEIEVEQPPNNESNKLPSIIEEEKTESMITLPLTLEVTQEEEGLSTYSLARDRQRRTTIVPPSRYSEANFVNFVINDMNHLNDNEPKTFDEAVSCPNARHWINAMNDEMESLTIIHGLW